MTFSFVCRKGPGTTPKPVGGAYSYSPGNIHSKVLGAIKPKPPQKDSPVTTSVSPSVVEYDASGENMTTTKWPHGSISSQKFDTAPKLTPIQFKLSAKNIPKQDQSIFTGSKAEHSDAYVNCYFHQGIRGTDTKFATTSTIENVKDAYWNDVVHFADYQKGENMYLNLKIKDADTTMDDDIGFALIELDPFWEAGKSITLNVRDIETEKDTGATITITPVPVLI